MPTPIKHTNGTLRLLREFYQDDRNEGDVSKYKSLTVARVLSMQMLKLVACSRPGFNAVLTPQGVREASRIVTKSKRRI